MKKILLFFVSLALLTTFGVFANDNPDNAGEGTPKTRQEIEAALTNFRFSYVLESDWQPTWNFFQARCAEGWASSMLRDGKGKLTVVDVAGKKTYLLDPVTKTGEYAPYNSAVSYTGINNSWLFIHLSYMNDSGFKRTGKTETVAGRKATIYTCKFGDSEGKFWIDNEFGFTLKYVQVATQSGAYNVHGEVTEFKVGGVTVADMVNLSEYKITEAKKIRN